jgi:hypothetical protein
VRPAQEHRDPAPADESPAPEAPTASEAEPSAPSTRPTTRPATPTRATTLRSARQREEPAPPSARELSPEELDRRRARRRLVAFVAGAAALLLVAGGLAIAFFSGWFTDDGRFDAAPKPCSVVNPELATRIVPGGIFTETGDLCSVDSPGASNGPKLTLTSNAAHREGRVSGEQIASRYLDRVFVGVGVRESGLGDEAVSYEPPGSRTIIILMRVSNVLITLTGAGDRTDGSTSAPADLVRDVARDVARRLAPR